MRINPGYAATQQRKTMQLNELNIRNMRTIGTSKIGTAKTCPPGSWGDFSTWEFAKGGGQNVSCDLGWGKRTIKHPLQNQFWRPQKVGFVWSVPVPLRRMTLRKQRGGKSYHKWGGSKTVFGEGFYGIFSPPLSFPPPFVFLWSTKLDRKPWRNGCEKSTWENSKNPVETAPRTCRFLSLACRGRTRPDKNRKTENPEGWLCQWWIWT